MMATLGNPEAPRVLWVDDQFDAGTVLLLKLEGFTVDCAPTAATGLSMARARAYHGIVLDQCLPDGSGLMVLEQLRSEGIPTPVMLLTGFGDIQSAVAALRLGALDYKQKPLVGDEWVDSLRALVGKTDRSSPHVVPDGRTHVQSDSRATAILTALISALRDATSGAPQGQPNGAALLAGAVANPALTVSAFVGCAEALRLMVTAPVVHSSAELAARAETVITQSVQRLNVEGHIAVVAAFESIQASLVGGRRPPDQQVARDVGLTVEDLERVLEFNTGRNFTEWRSLLAIQLGAQRLANSPEQVAQIAYALGFDHAAQFTREFHRTLGLTPTDFRRLLDT
jgi:ActR/RegA family two-component response regulator/AraC-like DNA-binding protein